MSAWSFGGGWIAGLAAAALSVGVATSARALSLSAPIITDSSTTTGTGGGGSADRASSRGSQIISTSVLGFDTRFFGVAAADRGAAFSGGTATAQLNVNYTITFSVTETLGFSYQIDVTTTLLGALTAFDDAVGLSGGGSSSVGNVTGVQTGGGTLTGGFSLASASSIGGTSGSSNSPISFNNLASIVGIGTGAAQVYTLNFQYTLKATSPQAVNGGDEHAARFGMVGATGSTLAGASADDYAGQGSRNGLNDGHFVNVTLIPLVPEPAASLLLALGLAGFAATRARGRA